MFQNIWQERIKCLRIKKSIAVPRDILKPVLLSNGSRLLIAHNHPSGCPEPSNQDVLFTKRVKEAGELLGIELLDNLIVGEETYYSFKEENKI